MNVVIAIDSLKGSMTSMEAGAAIKAGIEQVCRANVIIKPVADGGEGTVDAFVEGMGGQLQQIQVTGPLSQKVTSKYGIIEDSNTAVIEMAEAAGITLVPVENRNPLNTTTFGVGEIIKDAIKKGCRNFIIGIGGSATNDVGLGMLQALGFEFFDGNSQKVGITGADLNKVKSIKCNNRLEELDECNFKIACDVNNPLHGENGAAYIYGPQKGGTSEIIKELDKGALNFSSVVREQLNKDVANMPGAGAAGGLGYAFLAFLDGTLESGIQIVLEATKLEEAIKSADIVITGEGRLDYQTAMGKAPIGVAKLAKKYGIKVIAIAGATTRDARKCNEEGIDAYFSIVNGAMSLEDALNKDKARNNMIETTIQIFRLIESLNSSNSNVR